MAKGHLAVIEAQAGIAVDPATGLFFIGDTDTGMYLTDPGEIMFRADGQDILRVQQLGGDTYLDSLAFETYINRRAIIHSATEAPRLQLDLAAEGRAAIEFASSVAGGDGAIRYFDPTETPGLPSEMQFRVGDESIVHMLADSVEIDGDLTLDDGDLTVDGGDLSVHKTGGPTLKLSGMAGSEQGQILFEGLEGSGAIRFAPNPRQLIIQPNAASSLGWVIIDTSNVNIGGLGLLIDGVPVVASAGTAPEGYVRWADGTQIAWKTVQTGAINNAHGGVYISSVVSGQPWPASFFGDPPKVISQTLSDSGNAPRWHGHGTGWGTTSTTPPVWAVAGVSTANTATIRMVGIGRWKA